MELQSEFARNWWADRDMAEVESSLLCDAGRFARNRCVDEAIVVVMIGSKAFNLCCDHHSFAMSVVKDCRLEGIREC